MQPFFSCHMKHFTDTLISANIVSQYTLRYRYVTGSWLRPDTRQHPLTRPDGLVCSRHPLTDKL
ncbi:hypothetical protein ACR92H_26100 [Klebsiella pneumoniae]